MRGSMWMVMTLSVGVGYGLLAGCGPSDAEKKAIKDLNACTTARSKCESDLAARDKSIDKLRAQNQALADQVTTRGGKVSGLEGETEQLTGKLSASQAELEQLRLARAAAEKRMAAFKALAAKLRAMIDSGKIKVEVRKGRMIVKMSDKILFDPGKTELKPEGQAAIVQVTEALKGVEGRDFVVAGHTDNIPIKSKKFASNWELSTARAVEVVRFMINNGMESAHVSAAGFGEFDPIGDNTDETGRQQNRRIEIIVMPNVDELPKLDEGELQGG